MTTVRLFELAEAEGMPSVPSIRQLMRRRPDFPILQRGRKGAEYLFDLDAATAFIRANWKDARRFKQRLAAQDRARAPELPLCHGDNRC